MDLVDLSFGLQAHLQDWHLVLHKFLLGVVGEFSMPWRFYCIESIKMFLRNFLELWRGNHLPTILKLLLWNFESVDSGTGRSPLDRQLFLRKELSLGVRGEWVNRFALQQCRLCMGLKPIRDCFPALVNANVGVWSLALLFEIHTVVTFSLVL